MTLYELLKALEISLDAALRKADKLHLVGCPPDNTVVIWHTGVDTVQQLLNQLHELEDGKTPT